MSTIFDPRQGLIIVPARIWGPTGDTYAHLALDTGATSTMVRTAILVSIGYDPGVMADRVQITTASGIEFVPRLTVERIEALKQGRSPFQILCHTLPPTTLVDGVLGLDFLRGHRLVVDFRKARITLK